MLRKLIQAGAIVALFTSPVLAQDTSASQGSSFGIPLNYKRPPTQDEIDRQKAEEQAYDKAVQKIPDKKSSADPWGTIRPAAPASSTASKTKQQQ
jgi:hypothetical protein